MSDSLQPQTAPRHTPLVLHYLPEFTLTHVHWACEAIQPSHPPSPASYPALNLFQHQGLFQWVGSSHQVAEIWSSSFSISHSNEYSGLISYGIDWFDFLTVQGTLKSLLQHHNSKASILWHTVFFTVQLTYIHDCWKNHSFDFTNLCWQRDVSVD